MEELREKAICTILDNENNFNRIVIPESPWAKLGNKVNQNKIVNEFTERS